MGKYKSNLTKNSYAPKEEVWTSIVLTLEASGWQGHRMEFRKHKDGSLDIFNEFGKEFLHLNKRQVAHLKRTLQ